MPIYKVDKGYRVQVNYTDSFGNKKVIVKQNKDTAIDEAKGVLAAVEIIEDAIEGYKKTYAK